MAKDKSHQMDYKGLEIIADQFTGAVSGTVSGALAGETTVAVTATTGTLPTTTGAQVIANTATPTVVELLKLCMELRAKIDSIVAKMD